MALNDDIAPDKLHLGLDLGNDFQAVLPPEIKVRFPRHEATLGRSRQKLRKVCLLAANMIIKVKNIFIVTAV